MRWRHTFGALASGRGGTLLRRTQKRSKKASPGIMLPCAFRDLRASMKLNSPSQRSLRARRVKCGSRIALCRELDPARRPARAAPWATNYRLDCQLEPLGDFLFQRLDVGLEAQERSDCDCSGSRRWVRER